MFSSNSKSLGISSFSGRSTANAVCSSSTAASAIPCQSPYTWAFISQEGEGTYTATTIPGTATPFSSTLAVVGPTGIQIAANWATFFSSGGITNSLQAADVFAYCPSCSPTPPGSLFTGMTLYTDSGGAGQNSGNAGSCSASGAFWTDTGLTTPEIISAATTTPFYDFGATFSCANTGALLCVCLSAVTLSPTSLSPTVPSHSPTSQSPTPPTPAPTSQSPTHNPTNLPSASPTHTPPPTELELYIFQTSSNYPPYPDLSPEGRTKANSGCFSDGQWGDYDCFAGFAVLAGMPNENSLVNCVAYQPTPAPTPPTGTPFSCAFPVLAAPTGVAIASNWSQFISGNLIQPLEDQGLGGSFFYNQFLTGFAAGGANTPSPSLNCDGWSSMNDEDGYNVGVATSPQWLDVAQQSCFDGSEAPYLCLCLTEFTHSPTAFPSNQPTTSSPTKSPTRHPTTGHPSKSPSASPTHKPTAAPTLGPRIAPDLLTPIVFQTRSSFTGSQIQSRRTSSRLCDDDANNQLSCEWIWMLVGNPSDGLLTYANPVVPGFNVTFNGAAPIFSPNGAVLALNWTTMWTSGMLEPPALAGVSPQSSTTRSNIWTGLAAGPLGSGTGGLPVPNWKDCQAWTTSSDVQQGIVGNTGYDSYLWFNTPFGRARDTCDSAYPVLCACLSTVPATYSPTTPPAPTGSPTPWAPTPLPTFKPVVPTPVPTSLPSSPPSVSPTPVIRAHRLLMYVTGSHYTGNLGDRTSSNAICTGDAQYEAFGCLSGFAALGYDGELNTFPAAYFPGTNTALPTNVTVVGSNDVVLASNWTNFVGQGTLTNDALTAVSGLTESGTLYMGGIDTGAGGTLPPTFSPTGTNCGNWLVISDYASTPAVSSTSSGWWYGGQLYPCTFTFGVACVCLIENTASPTITTHAPSVSPTKRVVTDAPSRAPTAHLTPNPTFHPFAG